MIDKIALFAETNFRNERRKFGIKIDDRRRHVYVIGKTGVGKTTVLENMAIADIRAGHGMAIVDPHGEFADKMLDFIPKSRINDVIYFNPSDLDFPIALNVIEKVSPEQRHLVASGLVGVFKKIWADSWGPRLEYLLRNAILALLEYPNSTLLGIMRMLVDKTYRSKVIEKLQDPVVRSFWVDEFQKYPDRFLAEAVAPIQNKVGQFLTSPLIRNIVGQTKSKLNLRQVMDEGKILIMNLSKGLIGEDNSALLGAMMITRLQLAAMSRVDVPEAQRQDFYLYVDEFQNFATESFANILSEARKYRLDLILAHQYIAQLEEEVRDAVFGNVGTLITFRVGAEDAEFLERELMPEFTATDLVGLAKYDIYLKLMIDGMASRPFSATTLPPYSKEEKSCRETVIKLSRERYATPRDEVEMKIASWAGYGSKTLESEAIQKGKELHEAVCAHCGGKALLPFKPDNRRPVYCDGCLEKIRSGELPPIPKGDHKSDHKTEVGPNPPIHGLEKKIIEEVKVPKTKEMDSVKKVVSISASLGLKKPEPDKSALREALQNILKQRDS
jgi:CxxC-x17-CxxC domain-containing protein